MPPPSSPLAAPLPTPAYIDRRASLVFFGVLTVLMGEAGIVLIGLGVTGMIFAAKYGAPRSTAVLFLSISLWALLAGGLVLLGIGSIMARRWARAWFLLLSWNWFLRTASLVPPMLAGFRSGLISSQRSLSPEVRAVTLWIGFLILGVLFVVLPLMCAAFYGSKHVKATCEACDPVVRWTDRCPLPVIIAAFWAASSAATTLLSIGPYKGLFSFFGTFLTGPSGAAAHLVMALLWGYSAWALYHLDMRGWWLLLISVVVLLISTVITYSRHDIADYYAAIGYSGQRAASMRKLLQGSGMQWITVGWALPVLGYLFYLRRYFPRNRNEATAIAI